MSEKEYRVFRLGLELRDKHGDHDDDHDMDEEEKGLPTIEGYAARFDSLSEDLGGFREKIAPGAFDEVLSKNPDVRALVNHDSSQLLGRTLAGTLRLSLDTKGLKSEIDPPDTSVGRDTVTSIKRGDMDAMSFGFIVDRDEGVEWDFPDEGPAVRTITKIRDLFDVSPVTFPAYRATDISVAKRSLEEERAKISKFNKEKAEKTRAIIKEKRSKHKI